MIASLSLSLSLQIIEKGGDGWWEGRIADNVGSFPASFVEEIQSRDEGVKLLEVLKRKKSGGTLEEDIVQGTDAQILYYCYYLFVYLFQSPLNLLHVSQVKVMFLKQTFSQN